MQRTEVKDARVVMRRVDAHLRQRHLALGAQGEAVGFVDVVTHSESDLPALNYVTPRRNTAWVSAKHIEDGLSKLRTKGRRSRVRFAEGLFPPIFAKSLHELGLRLETEMPIMVYKQTQPSVEAPQLPAGHRIEQVDNPHDAAVWWYIWRNAFYDVYTSGTEPLALGREMRRLYEGRQHDLVLYKDHFPIGVARITVHDKSAHILSLAIMKEQRTAEKEALLAQCALYTALKVGCDLVFVVSSTETERAYYHKLGFTSYGSIMSYCEPYADTATEITLDKQAQPVLLI